MEKRRSRSAETPQYLPVWCGLSLGPWLRLLSWRPPMHTSRAGRIAGISAAACVNSLLHCLESARYGRQIARTSLSPSPLFILGHWRSGTTLLHELLAHDRRFATPTTYQVSFPGHFLLTERWVTRLTSRWLPRRRPMDDVPFEWNRPGEDEIAVLLTSLVSPYLRGAFPAPAGPVAARSTVGGLSAQDLDAWKTAFLHFLRKVALKSNRPLLLKSPAHTGRIPLLLSLFPQARFIYIVRNPYDVFLSTRHMFRVLCETNGLGRVVVNGELDEAVLAGYMDLFYAYHLQRALIPLERRIEIRYEDLVADPVGQIAGVYRHFGLEDFSQPEPAIRNAAVAIAAFRPNRFEMDEPTRTMIAHRWAPVFRRYRYPA